MSCGKAWLFATICTNMLYYVIMCYAQKNEMIYVAWPRIIQQFGFLDHLIQTYIMICSNEQQILVG